MRPCNIAEGERLSVTEQEPFVIRDVQQIVDLWTRVYADGCPDWSHLLPYYADDVHFADTVQELNGIAAFREMVERLARRSGDVRMQVLNAVKDGDVIFVEWQMTLRFRQTRTVTMPGLSRLTLNEKGKIVDQRDLYDLWGTIFDAIPGLRRAYRVFMRRVFG